MVACALFTLFAVGVSLATASADSSSTSQAQASSTSGVVQYYEVPEGGVGFCGQIMSDDDTWVKLEVKASSFEMSDCGKTVTIELDDGSSTEGQIEDGCSEDCKDGLLVVSKAIMNNLGYSGDAMSSAKPSASWSY